MVMVSNRVVEERSKGVKKNLFTPYQMGEIKLSHRIVMSPMTRCRAMNATPNESLVNYYTQRSTSGGLLITEGTLVSPVAERVAREVEVKGHGWLFPLKSYVPAHCPGIYNDQQVSEWKKLVDSVHAKGAIIFCQLWHVGQVSSNDQGGGSMSSMADVEEGSRSQEASIIEQFRLAALNAIHAGFDGVEIHAADGYLINQYLEIALNNINSQASNSNKSSSLEGITKFLMQVVQVVVETIGAERVGLRISPVVDQFEDTEFNSLDLGLAIVDALNKVQSNNTGSKLAYLHATRPRLDQGVVAQEAKGDADAQLLKKLRVAYEGTFIGSGGYNKDQGMEAVARGEADLVAYGRDFISNPDLVHRFKVDAPLNKYVRATFYTHDPISGYTDYPSLEIKEKIASY